MQLKTPHSQKKKRTKATKKQKKRTEINIKNENNKSNRTEIESHFVQLVKTIKLEIHPSRLWSNREIDVPAQGSRRRSCWKPSLPPSHAPAIHWNPRSHSISLGDWEKRMKTREESERCYSTAARSENKNVGRSQTTNTWWLSEGKF